MHISERLLAYFEQITGVQGGHINDAASLAFTVLGFSGALPDQWFAFLRASGYEGARPDMYSAFLADLEAGDAFTPTYAGLPAWLTFTRSTEGSYRDADQLIKWAGVDTPRFDHSRSGSPLGLLVEPQRTNSARHSADPYAGVLDETIDYTGLTVTGNGIPDPSGGTSAIRLETTVDDDNSIIVSAFGSAGGGDYVLSAWAFDATRGSVLLAALSASPPYFASEVVECGCRSYLVANGFPAEAGMFALQGYVPGVLDPVIGDQWSWWGAQAELIPAGQIKMPSSLIRTGGGGVTRQSDVLVCADSDWEALYRPIDGSPQQLVQMGAGVPFTGFGHIVAVRKI